MQFLRNHSKQAKSWIKLTVCCGLISNIFFIVQAYSLASIVDDVYLHDAPFILLVKWFWIIVICILLRALLAYYREHFSAKSADSAKTALRKSCFSYLLNSDSRSKQQYQAGELSTLLVEQIEATHDYCAHYLPQMM
ncbi:MAG: ABC transporter transmembrane domain-containing protein, partial [Gammaproteobacteria bacterium]